MIVFKGEDAGAGLAGTSAIAALGKAPSKPAASIAAIIWRRLTNVKRSSKARVTNYCGPPVFPGF